jgi:hypothetical protein
VGLDRTKISPELRLPESAPSRADAWGEEERLRTTFARKPRPHEEVAEREPVDYPEMVLLVAGFVFVRAVCLTVIGTLSLHHPHAEWASPNLFQLFFFMSNGEASVSPLTLVSILYTVVVGFGLLARGRWARKLLMITSVLAVLRLSQYIRPLSFISMDLPPHWLADTEFFWEGTFLLACVNTTIVIALRYAPGANAWFEKKK